MILAAQVLPLLVVWLNYGPDHPWFIGGLAVAILGPIAHAIRYPGVWLESFSISLALVAMLLVATWGGIPADAAGALLRGLSVTLTGFAVFMLACALQGYTLIEFGMRDWNFRARAKSQLPAADFLAALHEAGDDAYTRTPTAQDGLFELEFTGHVASHELDEDGNAIAQACTHSFFQKIVTDTDTVFEYFTFEEADGPVTVTRFEVFEDGEGSIVETSERAHMSVLMAFGFWLIDGLGDYLNDRISVAEGRTSLAIRGNVVNQLIVDIAKLFPQPDVDESGQRDIHD